MSLDWFQKKEAAVGTVALRERRVVKGRQGAADRGGSR